MTAPVFEMHHIRKAFPGVVALDDVSFDCHSGEVHALVGENGAGKSTLMKILSGVYEADDGSLAVDGQPVRFSHPVEALRAGISVIHQEFALLPDRTVSENIFLGHEPTQYGMLDTKRMDDETRAVLKLFGGSHKIDPSSVIGELSVAEQQMVEIAKAVALGAKIIVMDEPTAALNELECEVLFDLVDNLRKQGKAIVYITHRMREIDRLADRVTVLKDGQVTATFDGLPPTSDIIRAMVGRDIEDFFPQPAEPDEIGQAVLAVKRGSNDQLSDINLELRAGEIVGFAGLQGAGRTALAKALFGDEPFQTGEITIQGTSVSIQQPRDAVNNGFCMLPGDRKAEALLLMQSVRDNGMVSARAFSSIAGSHLHGKFGAVADNDDLLDQLDVRAASYEQEMRSLSGGNQQKTVVARWLALKPSVLIFVEPTRGIDVNAKVGIYQLMRELARDGAAVMMVSSDLPEVLGVSDRIIVMREGAIVGEYPRGTSEADIMHVATGEHDMAGAA